MPKKTYPPCPRCKSEDFFPVPDSLASACKTCGFVWVYVSKGKYEPGATIGQWLEDVYQIPNTIDPAWEEKKEEE